MVNEIVMHECVWVFVGAGARLPSGIFTTKEMAIQWVEKYKLTGVLTKYPVDESVYDWAVSSGYFTPKSDKQRTARFIGFFTTAIQEHYHFEDGAMA